MRYLLQLAVIFVPVAVITVIVFQILSVADSPWIAAVTAILSSIVAIALLSILFATVLRPYFQAQSYYVAILGFPKSGKTTIITSLFGQAFAGNITPLKMSPRGTQTIEHINSNLERLLKGQALGPTRSQDRFAFRADLTIKRFPLPRNYKIEFGDFPGSNTETYIKKYGRWLHTTEFFQWVAESDAMIFVIDLAQYLTNHRQRTNYVAQMTTAMRAAWQHYLDVNSHRQNKVIKHPLVLAFTKADLFGVIKKDASPDLIQKEIMKLGFGGETPPISEIDPLALKDGQEMIEHDFAELIRYFKVEAKNFNIIYCSCFSLYKNKMLGINDLMWSVLPQMY